MIVENNLTLEELKKQLTSDSVILWSAHTCWWTHRWEDTFRTPIRKGVKFTAAGGHSWVSDVRPIPCDPRGAVLLQTESGKALQFIEEAEKHPDHYGKHGLEAFMAAHAMNCRTEMGKPWAELSWDEYNDALDQKEAADEERTGK